MKELLNRFPALSGALILLSFLCIFSSLHGLLFRSGGTVPAFGAGTEPRRSSVSGAPVTVVLDPGHGGEDGGAVSPDGTAESGINLDIALRVRDILRLTGQRAVLTRTEDLSLGDASLGTIRARKASDIRRRVEIVNGTSGAVLLSIHQNSLPSSPVTHGAQVFWNREAGGQELAEAVQDALNSSVNADRAKRAKEIDGSIYLLRHVTVPAALAECGFLSNGEETAKLRTADHQREIAAALSAGVLRYVRGTE